jgi:acetyl-CoA carboxylase biotin carboxylase subunit
MTDDLRKRMGEAAVKLVKAAGYTNAGTVEFLVDRQMNFYFMEVNSRIQVEHPVTEEVTGVDIVKEQIRVAAGLPLSIRQEDVKIRGHAIECRVNAEDPDDNFRPSPGRIDTYAPPGGPKVRLDSHCYGGYNIPPFYDSMIAKVIARGDNREDALRVMRRALFEYVIEGISTTIPLHLRILSHAEFISGNVDTGFVENHVLPPGSKRSE